MGVPTAEKGSLRIHHALQEIFRKFQPNSEISVVERNNVPPNIMETLEERSELYIGLIDQKDVLALFLITHSNGDKTYVAQQRKLDSEEELSYFIDIGSDGEIMGLSEMMKILSDIKRGPFVRYTETLTDYRRRGLALRRLISMNAVSQITYDRPLRSSVIIDPIERNVWDKLVTQEKVIIYNEGSYGRYVFLDQIPQLPQ